MSERSSSGGISPSGYSPSARRIARLIDTSHGDRRRSIRIARIHPVSDEVSDQVGSQAGGLREPEGFPQEIIPPEGHERDDRSAPLSGRRIIFGRADRPEE